MFEHFVYCRNITDILHIYLIMIFYVDPQVYYRIQLRTVNVRRGSIIHLHFSTGYCIGSNYNYPRLL